MSRSTNSSNFHGCKLRLEPLSERIVPAVLIINGVLRIHGTNAIDYANVWDAGIGSKAKVHVNLNGTETSYLKSNFSNKIEFFGLGGDDHLMSSSSTPTSAYGGDGNDFLQTGSGDDHIRGEANNDTIKAGAGKDWLGGNGGNDNLDGGANDDTLNGYAGNDTLLGGSGNDSMDGGDGDDELMGNDGNDSLQGSKHNDKLFGGKGNDYLRGSDGNDELQGNSNDDTLYGGSGDDLLSGDSGLDALFAGLGIDTVSGGLDADRILTQDINGEDFNELDFDSDELVNVEDADAVVEFVNDDDAVWSESEILQIDGAFGRMHRLIGATTLLKNPKDADSPLEVHRQIDDGEDSALRARNNGSELIFYDSAFSGGELLLQNIAVHEIGHFWHDSEVNDSIDEFRALSGWTTKYGDDDPGDVLFVGDVYGEGGTWYRKAELGDWWYNGDALFVSNYATSSPYEDFAETFAAVIMGSDFYKPDWAFVPEAKRMVIEDWLASM